MAFVGLAACAAGVGAQAIPPAVKAAEASIDSEKIRAHVRFLSDDLLEGRGPGLRGADLAAKYIATEFALMGLKPAGDNGTYMQQVNFVGVKTIPAKTTAEFVPGSDSPLPIAFGTDYVTNNQAHTPSVDIDVPIVFAGYGVTAPEYGWDDYAGLDVKGKVVLVIVGDPPSDDPKFFKGKAMTYYGRWTYKFEQAARMGAVGALIIHRTDLASYGWSVVEHSWSGEKTYLRDDKKPPLQSASWIQLSVAGKLFAAAGKDPDANVEIAAAGKNGFKGYELPVKMKLHLESEIRPFVSPNVIGKIEGAQPNTQALLYTAHYDHLGFMPGMAGDNIYNGAVDNGTGSGLVLELARAWGAMTVKPPHDVFFALVTAEEQGLLGSEYLGQHPPVPPKELSLDLNYDALLPQGEPRSVEVAGAERTTFYPVVESTAKRFGLTIVPEAHPEAGGYYRSDHFSLARVGIPAFSIDQGTLFAGHDEAWGLAKAKEYNEKHYHDFSDNYSEDMDFRGLATMARFGMDLGWQALTAKGTVGWQPGDEFEAARKAGGN
ncbi:peptidase M28 [Granulicella sibirica]|uniref:Peptidase M28 n=2 Tax=Granulicella sibirica TaxID=2479048 RepID=A0A4Q0T6G4_9BACT|nr:peptidase M28 [Granulicella sibirica]